MKQRQSKDKMTMQPAAQRLPSDAELRRDSWEGIANTFADLGKSEHVGNAFAITRRALALEVNGNWEKFVAKLPRPDYEHGIWHDTATDNLIVIRADKDGRYALEALAGAGSKLGKRLR